MSFGRDVERLKLMLRTLHNARDNAAARPALDEVGYTLKGLEAAEGLYDAAQTQITEQQLTDQHYDDAAEDLRTHSAKVDRNHTIDRAIAQREFATDPKVREYLGLLGEQDTSVPGRSEHLRKLYTITLSEAASKTLTDGGISAERRAERWADVLLEQKKRAAVLAALSKREEATATRDHAIDQALAWLTGFRRVARKVFKNQPHMLALFELD